MQPSTFNRDSPYTSLGERRGQSDLARFSLDLNWARGVSESARSRAYPSPPMSGSPPIPPRRIPEFDDRGQGGLSAAAQDVSRRWPTSQTDLREGFRVAPLGPLYPQESQPAQYPQYQRMGDVQTEQAQYQYQQAQQQQQRRPPQQMAPLPMYPLHHPHLPVHFHEPDRFPSNEEPGYSPKAQRKTKGHVASACVPCKKAHLRCDAERPCSRCISNGKEETCIDVQHKKRGRPRLRDDREQRFEGLGHSFTPQPEHILRRPMSMYSPSHSPMHQSEALNRSGPYRVLKSQSGASMVPRYLEHASSADANLYPNQGAPISRSGGGQEIPSVYLNTDLQISTANRSFCELLGVSSLNGTKLLEIVSPTDRDKVYRLQRVFEDERQEREPNYLPPIYGKAEEDRVIQLVSQNPGDGIPFSTEHQELFTFVEPSGQHRSYQVRLGLAKKESTYFVILFLALPATPATPQETYQMSSSPFPPRDPNYGFRPPPQSFAPPTMIPYPPYQTHYNEPRLHDTQIPYRQPPPLLSNSASTSGPASNTPSHAQPFTRQDYGQAQNPRMVPRAELPQDQPQRQSEFRLPPIQNRPGETLSGGRGDERGGRVDIVGLLENPELKRRKS